MQARFSFQLGVPTKSGAIYTMDIITALDKFIEENGIILMYNGSDTFDKYSANEFIGLATSYNILSNFVFINFDITNTRFNALKNLSDTPLGIPLVEGEIDPLTNEVKVNVIDAIVIDV